MILNNTISDTRCSWSVWLEILQMLIISMIRSKSKVKVSSSEVCYTKTLKALKNYETPHLNY